MEQLLEASEKSMVAGRLGKRIRTWNTTDPYPLTLTCGVNSAHQKWTPGCGQESCGRCPLFWLQLREGELWMFKECGNCSSLALLFSFPLPSPLLLFLAPPFLFHPFPPFFYAPAPRNLVGVVASHQPKLWDRGNSLCLQWCHSSQKLGPSPTAFFPSPCPLSAWRYLGEVIDVHGRVSFLSRDSKGVPGNQKVSGRSWSGRNWAKKPHKVFFKINFCTHPSNYTCMDLIISTSKLWGLCLGARLTIQWHAHGTEPSCTAKALKSEMTREPEPLENQLVAWNTQSEPNQVECILNQKY